jgi:cell division protein FtsQ
VSFRAVAHPARCRGFATGLFALALLFLAVVAGIVWIGMGIVASERWPIRWLELDGNFQRVSAEQLRSSLSSRLGTNFFTVDLHGLHEAAASSAWVSDVRVQKMWPDTIRVSVDEYTPVAHWNNGRLISQEGEIFAVPEADEIQGLPWLSGPDERLPDLLRHWVGFNERLLPLGLEITRLTLDGRGAWSLELDNGTQVRLGRDATAERLQRLLASWETLSRMREVQPQEVDLRYTNGFAVAWPQPLERVAKQN